MYRTASYLVALAPLTVLLACSGANDFGEPAGQQRQALVDPSTILGFEDASQWTASAGTKSTNTDRSQGDFSLGLAGFGYAELVSAPLSNLPGVTSTLAFDLKVPVDPQWGQAALSIDAPSLGIHNAYLGQIQLPGSPAGQWRTLSFALPSHFVTALGQNYADLRLKVILNAAPIAQPYLVDNLRFAGGSSENNTVALTVTDVDDLVYVTVNGLRREVVGPGGISNLDVSSWFLPGANSVRIQLIDTFGAASFGVDLRVDGIPVIEESCPSAPCDTALPPGPGVLFDRTYTVNTSQRPAAGHLNVNGAGGGKIYIDDAYTGHSVPHSFSLPPGSYNVGVGMSDDSPPAYTGSFHEQVVDLDAGETLAVSPTSGAPLDTPNVTRVAILPIRTTYHGDETPQNTGVLADSDIPVMHGQALATNEQYVEPFSYGLTSWDVEVLPTVEDTALRRDANELIAPEVNTFLAEANLTSLEQQYDSVVLFYSVYTASGSPVGNSPCCWWAHASNKVSFQNNLTRSPDWPASRPNVFLLHEVLHNYELYNEAVLRFYNGVAGVHGATDHGYVRNENDEEDFLVFYRDLMRGQVPEAKTMRPGVLWSEPRPTTPDVWVGLFETFRNGVQWPFATQQMVGQVPSPLAGAIPKVSGEPSCGLRASPSL